MAIGGRLVTASSSVILEPGALLRARVERSGEGLLLRLAAKEGREPAARDGAAARAAAALSAAGLPSDPAARAAFAALLREGMAPDARALARVRRAALRDADSGGEEADLAAKMEAKGMPAEEEALGEILFLMEGRGGEGEGGGEGKEPEPDARPPAGLAAEPFAPGDLDEDFSVELPEGELPRYLAALLRSLAMRQGGGCDSLALFNHLRSPEGSWVILPFRFDLDAVDFAGSFRIQLPYVRGGQGRFEAVFSASRGPSTEDWSFFVSFGGGRAPSLRIDAPRGAEARARSRVEALARSLAARSCSVRIGGGDRGEEPSGAGVAGLDFDA